MKFVVVGAGAWGTAFALHLARSGHPVVLVPRRDDQAKALLQDRENKEYLPGVALPAALAITARLEEAATQADVFLFASPSQALRETCGKVRDAAGAARPKMLLSLAKGLEMTTHLRPSQVMRAAWPEVAVGSLTGPTNALGVARGDPSAMTLAAEDGTAFLAALQTALSSSTMRVYTSDDVAGVEFGGCLKNIYAIAAGCCDGLKLGDNTKAALLTRALAEMVRVGVALGARAETFYGLSGFGDLIATCYGGWSRNRDFGAQIGMGRPVSELLANRKTVVEGYNTTRAFAGLCIERRIDAPILREVHAILCEGRKPADALAALMTRELKRETMPSEPAAAGGR